MKPSARCERLEFVWRKRSWNVLGGRSYVWIRSICVTRSGGRLSRARLFDPMSCLLALMKSTWSMNGDFHSVLHLQLSEPSSVDAFRHRYPLLASVLHWNPVPQQCLFAKAYVFLKATSSSSGNPTPKESKPESLSDCSIRLNFDASICTSSCGACISRGWLEDP